MEEERKLTTLRPDVQELLTCKCGDPSHQMVIGYNLDEYEEVYLSIHLVREHNIFKRMWVALKYVFGRRSIYGDYDEIVLSEHDAPKLQRVVDHLNKGCS